MNDVNNNSLEIQLLNEDLTEITEHLGLGRLMIFVYPGRRSPIVLRTSLKTFPQSIVSLVLAADSPDVKAGVGAGAKIDSRPDSKPSSNLAVVGYTNTKRATASFASLYRLTPLPPTRVLDLGDHGHKRSV